MSSRFAIANEIIKSPQYEVLQRLETLKLNYQLFNRNYIELKSFLDKVKSKDAFPKIWPQDKRHVLEVVLLEITRLTHNYLASARTLVEHTRILMRDWYKDHEFLLVYHAKVSQQFSEDPLSNFVEDLRNYSLHYKLPFVTAQIIVSMQDKSLSQKFLLDKDILYDWKGWKKYGLAFLNYSEDRIDIEFIVDTYFSKAKEFHNWLYESLYTLHKDEIEWFQKMQQKLNDLEE